MMCPVRVWFVFSLILSTVSALADCVACTDIQPGVAWGEVTANAITEASGIAASRRNVGVLWTHNDGGRDRVFALTTNGTLLAAFNLNKNVDDVEDIAVGIGPLAGISYLYVGDIGGNKGTNTVRNAVRVLRTQEPRVDPAWAENPPTADLQAVDTFNLTYPDGSHDAEALLLDPLTGDLIIATKDPETTRLYRANVNFVPNQATLTLEFIGSLSFTNVSGGDISPDGTQIILRREDAALVWARCDNESMAEAFAHPGQPIPVIGPPLEPNGEGVGFVAAGSGYVTISEGNHPRLYFFASACPVAPQFTLGLANEFGFLGGAIRFETMVVAYPPPQYTWRFNGEVLPGETNSFLVLSNLAASHGGHYELTASNAQGTATSAANLTIRTKPDLRITEVFPNAANNTNVTTADWWELTSFETQPVNLSGWRFNDNSGGLADPFIIPAGTTIASGESIVFAEAITPERFRLWWGASNLPPALKIISYAGGGLGLGANGDGIRLWNSVTTDPADTDASVDFGNSDAGVSFNYDPITRQFGAKSQLGVNGVIRAAAGTDIGSPGRIVAPPESPLLTARLLGETLRIEFDATVGHRYSLEVRNSFDGDAWTSTSDTFVATNSSRAAFEKPASASQRFYRVRAE